MLTGEKMTTFTIKDTVGNIVVKHPSLGRILEDAGIDYCCGGKKPLQQACQEKSLDPEALLAKLQQALLDANDSQQEDPAKMSLIQLADHIVYQHHGYLKNELPRLDAITDRVASVHGGHDPRLVQVREAFIPLHQELMHHMNKEEQVLFPRIREIDTADSPPDLHCGSLALPIHQMEHEHEDAGSALETIRELTDEYMPPSWACNTYRVMLDSLSQLEQDLHWHVHKENNILFPRALERENELSQKSNGSCHGAGGTVPSLKYHYTR